MPRAGSETPSSQSHANATVDRYGDIGYARLIYEQSACSSGMQRRDLRQIDTAVDVTKALAKLWSI